METTVPGRSYGTFKISAYCGCEACSGGHLYTYSGAVPKEDHTISADLDQFPLGTKLLIDGIIYTVEDKGSGVVENHLDIYFDTHKEALDYGLQKKGRALSSRFPFLFVILIYRSLDPHFSLHFCEALHCEIQVLFCMSRRNLGTYTVTSLGNYRIAEAYYVYALI